MSIKSNSEEDISLNIKLPMPPIDEKGRIRLYLKNEKRIGKKNFY